MVTGGCGFVTKPLGFTGKEIALNFATSTAGSVKVEILDEMRCPIPGYRLEDSLEPIGNAIEWPVDWKQGSDVGALAGKVLRFRFVMDGADLYALGFH